MMFFSIFSSFFIACSISNSTPSASSQEAKIRLELEKLQQRTQILYEHSHQLESEIDEVRRNAQPDSEEAIQKLELQIKKIREEQNLLKEEFKAWKLQLIPENSKQ